jgi:osmotically inducible protein OsmC
LDLQALSIARIHLELTATPIDGVDAAKFKEIAEGAKANCIISKALSVPVTLSVTYAWRQTPFSTLKSLQRQRT